MHEIPDSTRAKLSELERREWHKLINSPWYQKQITNRVRALVNQFPPHYIYVMKDTGEYVFITQYHENKEDPNQPIMLEVSLDRQYNKGMLINHPNRLILLMPEVLEKLELRSIVDQESKVAEQGRAIYMPGLANRAQAMRIDQDRGAQERLDRIKSALKKGRHH